MTRSERKAEWQRKVEEQERSGKSIADWCRAESVNVKLFRRWKHKLRPDTDTPAGCCQVRVRREAERSCSLTLSVDERITIELAAGFDRQLLKEVLSVLVS